MSRSFLPVALYEDLNWLCSLQRQFFPSSGFNDLITAISKRGKPLYLSALNICLRVKVA